MKQHKKLKAAVALVLCVCFVLSGISAETAFAANKKFPLKVTFNGVEASMDKDLYDMNADKGTISSLKKSWGKPKTSKDGDATSYSWEKGKSYVWLYDRQPEYPGGEGPLMIDIKDKNGAVWGVTVGTKKDAALKKLKKVFGAKKVYKKEEDAWNFGGIVVNKKSIEAFAGPYGPVTYKLKNGKVSSIYFFHS